VKGNFAHIVVCDFEYEVAAGELPNVLSMVAYVLDEHLQHVRTVRLWRGEFPNSPPFDVDDNTLFVAYSAWAEMTCFLVLGWKFPKHIFDQHTAYLAATNVLLPYDPEPEAERKRERKRLSDACRAYGIEGWEKIDKGTIAEDIGNWQKYGREGVLQYNEEDTRVEAELFRRQLQGNPRRQYGFQPANTDQVIYWSNYSAKAIARIQARGMPIDMPLWNLVQENKAAIVGELLRRFDPSYGSDDPIYTPEGEWAYLRFRHAK
jgi:DNA polymerase I